MKKLLLTLTCLLTLFSAMAGTQDFGSGTSIPGMVTAQKDANDTPVKWTSEALGIEMTMVQCAKYSGYLMATKNNSTITFTVSKAIQKISITTPAGNQATNGTLALYTGDATDYDCYNICNTANTTYDFVPAVKAAGTTYVLKNINNPEDSGKNGNVQIASMTILYEGETEEQPVEPTTVEVANIAALLTANTDLASGATSADTYKFTNPVTAIYQNGSNLYIKDNTGYLLVYGSLGKTYENGDIIPAGIEGQVKNYYDLYEFLPKTATFADATAGEEVEPIVTTVDDAAADGQNSYIELRGVTIEGMPDAIGNFTITDPATSETITGRNNFKINPSNGTGLTLRGFVAIYNGTYQIYPTEILDGSGMAAVVAPTFNPAAGEVIAGTKVNIYTTTADAAIYYTIDGTEPTTSSTLFTTAIEINADMTIKAIAVKEGMANSSVSTAVYTVKADDQDVATFNFAKPETLTPAYPASIADEGLTNESGNKSATVTGKYFTVGNVAVSNTKGKDTDAKIYYQSGGKIQLRVYNGGSTTIQSTDPDNNIVKIVFTYNNGKTSSDKVTAPTEGKWTAAEGTWTGNAQSVTFNYTGTQQINQIEVTCANGITEGSEITGPKAIEVASIAAWLDANADIASGKDSKDTFKFTCPLSVARQFGNNLYVTDGTDWMLIFGYNMPAYNNGDIIPAGVEGTFSNYYGLPEFKPVLATLGTATAGAAVEPVVTTLDSFEQLGKNAYIKLVNVNIADINGKNFNITDGTNTVAGYNSFNIEGLEAAEGVDVIAFVGYFKTNYQLSIVEFSANAGIDAVIGDNNAPVEYYNIQGIRVMHPAQGGIYIKRQGNTVSKVIVR